MKIKDLNDEIADLKKSRDEVQEKKKLNAWAAGRWRLDSQEMVKLDSRPRCCNLPINGVTESQENMATMSRKSAEYSSWKSCAGWHTHPEIR